MTDRSEGDDREPIAGPSVGGVNTSAAPRSSSSRRRSNANPASAGTSTAGKRRSQNPSSRHTEAQDTAEILELDDIRRYESFSTVDWIVDSTRERARVARAKARESSASASSNSHLANGNTQWGSFGYAPGERPPRWWPSGNMWGRRAWWVTRLAMKGAKAGMDSGVVILVGVLIGINMAIISIATEWASDLKQGYCRAGWWLNQKFCCWEMMDPAGPGGAAIPHAVKAANSGLTNVTTTLGSPALTRAVQMVDHVNELYSYATRDTPASSSDISETCSDWIPWSSWTFPAWILYIAFSALLAASCAHLVRAFAPYAAGSGITEIKCILAGFIINGFLGFQTFVIKSLTLPLAIASGLSVGKEGPAVHVACCIGNVVSGFFKSFDRSQARMRELLTAASAAGVAVAFGSPIGGVLFSLEEMAYQFPATTMWRSFLCALAATVTLSFMNPFRTGKLVLFQVSYDRDWHYFEMIFYAILGIFGGLYGAFVIKYNLQVQAFRRGNLAAHGVSEAVLLAVLTAFIGYWNKFLRIDMTESLEILFRECEGGGDYDNLCQSWAQWRMVNSLLLATVLRFALVILSYGCKVPAGIFVPSMAIGATFGRMIGILVKALYNAFPNAAIFSACQPDVPCITPGTYAFLGAAAALAGVTRITAAVVVIMFELTGALTYILPTMIVVMITKGVGDLYGKGGIAEQTMKFAGYPFLDKDEHNFGLLPVREIMKRDPDVVHSQGMQLQDAEKRLNNEHRGFPVVRSAEDQTLLGYIGKTELRYALTKAKRTRGGLQPESMVYFTCEDSNESKSHSASRTPFADDLGSSADEPHTAATSSKLLDVGGVHLDGDEDDEDDAGRGQGRRGGGNDDQDDDMGGLLSHVGRDSIEDGADQQGDTTPQDKTFTPLSLEALELGKWVDQTPLSVAPSMPLEVVMDLFKKMGPRVILVTNRQGSLEGLVTVKDLLKHIAAQEHADALAAQAARDASDASGNGGLPEWVIAGDPRDERDRSQPFSATAFGGELEAMLSDAWSWTRRKAELWSSSRPNRSATAHADYTELRESGNRREESVGEAPHHVLYDEDEEVENSGGTTATPSTSASAARTSTNQSTRGDTSFVID
ncbi:unnamed protein product [Sympodiomycopsis kandeliae]